MLSPFISLFRSPLFRPGRRIAVCGVPLAFPALFALLSTLALAAAEPAPLPTVVGFNRDIRPLLSNTCFKCHGPDVKNNQSDLRLDLPEMALAPHRDKNGRVSTPLVPGQPAASEVWRRITAADPLVAMPPHDAPRQLSPRDKALLQRWIEQGAKYERHWAYLAPKKTEPPTAGDSARVRNPIDRFILAALAERGFQPSPEADRRTLIRRVSLDLVGLPPTPEETEAFVADSRPEAYERLVDRLLASPHYGERMAVPWLDLARFADSVGYHGDQLQNNFPYREYVIAAFNRNEPFDQFTVEQLAGDLLPGATAEQRVATGFNRLNMMTREGGAQSKEYLAKYAADRVRTVSTVWLGSTMACCECHDHKFDPFKTRDFYSLAAYFADIKQYGVYMDYTYTPEPELAGFSNDSPFPPEIEVKSPYLEERRARFSARLDAHVAASGRAAQAEPEGAAAIAAWAAQAAARLQTDPGGWATARIDRATADKKRKIAPLPDGSVLLQEAPEKMAAAKSPPAAAEPAEKPVGLELTLSAPAGPASAFRIEVLPDPAHDGRVVSGKKDAFAVSKVEILLQRAGEDQPRPLDLAAAYPDRETDSYFNGQPLTSLLDGWTSKKRDVREPQSAVYLLTHPLVLAEGDRLIAKLTCTNVGRIRLAASPFGCRFPTDPLSPAETEAFAAAHPTPVQAQLVAAEYFRGTGLPQGGDYPGALAELGQIAACRNGLAFSAVTVAAEPRVTHVLPRGDWQNETGEIVSPAPPSFLGGLAPAGPDRSTRLDLARWLTSRDNPLTARAYVNRLWMQFFGAGLSPTVDDLGTRGDYPSNPELLDWLAVDFMDRGWNVKAMVRLLVTSGTYRQSSRYRSDLAEIDPQDSLLARQNPRRLDAEFVRDNALFAAGLLNLDLGGPSAYPYQPEGYYAAIMFPTRDYFPDQDDRQYRRGVYVHWQRTFLHPMLANFDAPSREECTAARTVSSTPQQALTLLNDPTFVEAARGLAERMLAEPAANFAARLDLAYERLLARPARAPERSSLQTFYQGQLDYYRAHPADAEKFTAIGLHPVPAGVDRADLAAWTALARVLLNLNETIVRY